MKRFMWLLILIAAAGCSSRQLEKTPDANQFLKAQLTEADSALITGKLILEKSNYDRYRLTRISLYRKDTVSVDYFDSYGPALKAYRNNYSAMARTLTWSKILKNETWRAM